MYTCQRMAELRKCRTHRVVDRAPSSVPVSLSRRMFPAIKVELYDLKPDVSYILLMDMAPVDKYRYKYNAGWVRCFEEECAPTRLYIHPDSPALGTHWTSIVINFYKLKLTNNQLDKQGHVSYHTLPMLPVFTLCHHRS